MESNYHKLFYKDYEIEINKNKLLTDENKYLKLEYAIANDEKIRAQKSERRALHKLEIVEQERDDYKLKYEESQKELARLRYENEKFMQKEKNDSTNTGIPTGQTKIGKKKLVPNEREKSEKHIGGQENHPKSSLESFKDEEVTEIVKHTMDKCPKCGSMNIVEIDKKIKDVFDYLLSLEKKRNEFIVYECQECHCTFHESIPNNLKEKNQYGNKVQATALSLMNIGNVPINKVKRIISGLTMNEINLSEGLIAKLQKRAAHKLIAFKNELCDYIIKLKIVHWDDTVIMICQKQACMRFYGNEIVALYFAHEKKNKVGIDADNILPMLNKETIVMHDHNKVNYNSDYSFINAECNQHLLRDLKKVSDNIPSRTWANKLRDLLKEFDHKRNELIKNDINSFNAGEINDFIMGVDNCILLGIEENKNDSSPYYAEKERTLINRLMEFRDNYIYWIFDFDLPFTNNVSERGLRGVKSKMKISGQFQNITNAEYYALIRSYIETCHRNGVNEHDAMERLIDDNPYSLEEILTIGKENAEKRA